MTTTEERTELPRSGSGRLVVRKLGWDAPLKVGEEPVPHATVFLVADPCSLAGHNGSEFDALAAALAAPQGGRPFTFDVVRFDVELDEDKPIEEHGLRTSDFLSDALAVFNAHATGLNILVSQGLASTVVLRLAGIFTKQNVDGIVMIGPSPVGAPSWQRALLRDTPDSLVSTAGPCCLWPALARLLLRAEYGNREARQARFRQLMDGTGINSLEAKCLRARRALRQLEPPRDDLTRSVGACVPICVVRGTHDSITAERDATQLCSVLAQGSFEASSGAGHSVAVDNIPAALASLQNLVQSIVTERQKYGIESGSRKRERCENQRLGCVPRMGCGGPAMSSMSSGAGKAPKKADPIGREVTTSGMIDVDNYATM